MFDHICHEKAIFHKGLGHFAIFILCKMTAVLCFEDRRFMFSVGFFFVSCGVIFALRKNAQTVINTIFEGNMASTSV